VSATPITVSDKSHKTLKYLRFVDLIKNWAGKTKIDGWNLYKLPAEMPQKLLKARANIRILA